MAAMIRSRAQPLLVVAAALGTLYIALFAIAGSTMFARAPERLALAVTFDLMVTATAVVWWFGVRRKAVSPWVAVAVLSWGVVAARRWVPHAPLGALVVIGGGLEVVTVGWLLIRIRRVVQVARASRDEGPIGSVCAGLLAARVPARLATILASEIAVVGLALTGWFRRPAPGALSTSEASRGGWGPDGSAGGAGRSPVLSMRSTGWMLIAGVFGGLIIAESVVIHIALATLWSPLAAWIASASSGYALLWLAGDAQAIRLYPVAVTGGTLHLRLGVRWRAKVPLAQIASIEETRTVPRGAINLALMEPTVLITLRAPVTLQGLLGKTRRGDRIALTIDDPKALIAAVGSATP
jgi:hypothetical protein